jgi:hypothetical protein
MANKASLLVGMERAATVLDVALEALFSGDNNAMSD